MNNIFVKENAFIITLTVSVLFLLIFYILSALQLIQSTESLAFIGEASRWCERVSDGAFREPVNTLSNLGFMFAGLFILYKLSNEVSFNEFSGLNKITILYGVAVVYLGPGSMMMHGTNTEWGGWADNLSMVMYIILPWLYNCYKMSNWSVNTLMKIYFATIIVYAFMRGMFGYEMGIGLDLFGVSIGLWVISEFLYRFWSPTMRILSGFVGFLVLMLFGTMPAEVFNDFNEYWWIIFFWLPGLVCNKKPDFERKHFPWFFIGMFLYISAFVIWLQGYPNQPLCNPDSLIQPHGIWHILCSLATLSFFVFLRTEQTKKREA